MVIDTSAVTAILFNEPVAAALEQHIADDPVRLMSVGTFIEVSIVVEARLGDAGGRELDLWLHRAEIELVSADSEQASMARRAWRRFGKGRHPAALNYGDCFSYALAVTRDEPLLFMGDDFPRTDVKCCTLGSG